MMASAAAWGVRMRFDGLVLTSALLLSALGHAFPVSGQEYSYQYAYLSRVEGEVSLQRASELEPEEGAQNVPILPGDRLWTLGDSRAETRFADGTAVRISEGSKLDFVELESETILRVWSGSAILELTETHGSLRIDSPAGTIRPAKAGSYRIDVENGDRVTLSVPHGSAELANRHGTVLVQSGEASSASESDPPSIPAPFNTASLDEFGRWSDRIDQETSSPREVVIRSLPHEVRPYAEDLDRYGDWDYDTDYGYVWYPQVSVGWAPYTHGHWWNSSFGHTWISSEPWGWAPYHYGRWGFRSRGWYWIPGATWGPAWVSFAIGPTWIGWSPLGYHNSSVFLFNSYYGSHWNRGRHGRGDWNGYHGGWNFCSRDDFRRNGVVTRDGYRRLDPDVIRQNVNVSGARVVAESSALDRELGSEATSRERRGAVRREAVRTLSPGRPVESAPSVEDRSGERSARASERVRSEARESTTAARSTPSRNVPEVVPRSRSFSAGERTGVETGRVERSDSPRSRPSRIEREDRPRQPERTESPQPERSASRRRVADSPEPERRASEASPEATASRAEPSAVAERESAERRAAGVGSPRHSRKSEASIDRREAAGVGPRGTDRSPSSGESMRIPTRREREGTQKREPGVSRTRPERGSERPPAVRNERGASRERVTEPSPGEMSRSRNSGRERERSFSGVSSDRGNRGHRGSEEMSRGQSSAREQRSSSGVSAERGSRGHRGSGEMSRGGSSGREQRSSSGVSSERGTRGNRGSGGSAGGGARSRPNRER